MTWNKNSTKQSSIWEAMDGNEIGSFLKIRMVLSRHNEKESVLENHLL